MCARFCPLNTRVFSVAEKRRADRKQQYKAVSQHMKKEDESRTRAYGWSIPANVPTDATLSIPVPVCCRPLLDQHPSLKVWCATGTLLHGGVDKTGDFIVGDSIFYRDPLNGLHDKLDSSMVCCSPLANNFSPNCSVLAHKTSRRKNNLGIVEPRKDHAVILHATHFIAQFGAIVCATRKISMNIAIIKLPFSVYQNKRQARRPVF